MNQYKRYETCANCPTIGLPPRRIGWTGREWVHIDTKLHWCVLPQIATPA